MLRIPAAPHRRVRSPAQRRSPRGGSMDTVVMPEVVGRLTTGRPAAPAPDHPLIDAMVARLSDDFHTDAGMVAEQAEDILRRRYADARVQSFIPILVERELRQILRAGRNHPCPTTG